MRYPIAPATDPAWLEQRRRWDLATERIARLTASRDARWALADAARLAAARPGASSAGELLEAAADMLATHGLGAALALLRAAGRR